MGAIVAGMVKEINNSLVSRFKTQLYRRKPMSGTIKLSKNTWCRSSS